MWHYWVLERARNTRQLQKCVNLILFGSHNLASGVFLEEALAPLPSA